MTEINSQLELEKRSGLPEALRVLVNEFPSEKWQSHENFEGLVRFWLDRHVMFRRLVSMMIEESESILDREMDYAQYRQRLARLGSMFVGELHAHHSIEDYQYFPRLKLLDQRLERGFEILDADHHALDAHLQALTDQANSVIQTDDAKALEKIGELHGTLGNMRSFLERHLADEEELIVPVILKHGFRG